MAVDYRTIAHEGYSEITEKKSRFLGEAVRAATLKEAEEYIAAVRKRHYDARHHCFAFCVGEPGTPDEIWRSSDDGEPSGTAGKPMLEILKGRELHRTLLVVTRYFGGTLLGTGGLVRAYSAGRTGPGLFRGGKGSGGQRGDRAGQAGHPAAHRLYLPGPRTLPVSVCQGGNYDRRYKVRRECHAGSDRSGV